MNTRGELNGFEILNELMKGRWFLLEHPPCIHIVLIDLYDAALAAMGEDLLKSRVTADTFIRTRLVALRLQADPTWRSRELEARQLTRVERELGEALDEDHEARLIAELGSILADLQATFEKHRLTEERFLAHTSIHGGRLTAATMERWREGDMTIEDLLRMQPDAIFVNRYGPRLSFMLEGVPIDPWMDQLVTALEQRGYFQQTR